MKSWIVGIAIVALSLGLLPATAGAVTLPLSGAVLEGGASTNGGAATKIMFHPNQTDETATFTFPVTSGQEYVIAVAGHNNSSSSFFNFFIDADGGADFSLLYQFSFFGGFSTIALPSFTALGTEASFRIAPGGTGQNSEGQILAVDLSIAVVPGPVVGAGLPALVMALGGLVILSRRRRTLGAVA